MFGAPGFVYVYFTYGMHFCMNLVCEGVGTAAAVLLRAGEVIEGVELASRRRGSPPRDLARGPARLTVALGVGRAEYGLDACDPASAAAGAARRQARSRSRAQRSAGRPVRGCADAVALLVGRRADRVALSRARRETPSSQAVRALTPPMRKDSGVTQTPHFLDDLTWRGLIAVSTDLGALRAALDDGPITLYCGFDPTAAELAPRKPRPDPHAAAISGRRAPSACARRRGHRADRGSEGELRAPAQRPADRCGLGREDQDARSRHSSISAGDLPPSQR